LSFPIPFAPGARTDLEDAVEWYERRRAGLGLEFLEAVTDTAQRIARWPQVGRLVPHVAGHLTARRCPVHRITHHIVCVVAEDRIYVVAIAHNRRRPGYWTGRLD